MKMDNVDIKVLSIAILFVLGLVGGIPPLCCIRPNPESSNIGLSSTARRVISLLNSAAAGIFLSIALVHLLPDARLLFETSLNITNREGDGSQAGGGVKSFEWAGFTAACGFLFVVLVEQMMMWCMEQVPDDPSQVESGNPWPDDGEQICETKGSENFDYGALRNRSPSGQSSETSSQHSFMTISVKSLDDALSYQPLSTLRAIILLVSLSIHSVFEGLAVGLQLAPKDTIDLLVAIAVHKAIESFTVLLRFAQIPGKTALKWTSLFIFSLASPLGIAIGIPLANPSLDADALLVNAVLQGLATGTFMFVTFVELLPVELAGKKDRILKFVFLLAGFGLMCGLTQV